VYAVVYIDGKKHNLGRWDSPEAKQAYAKFDASYDEKVRAPLPHRIKR